MFVHVVDVFGAYGEVVGRVVFSLLAKADSFYADLEGTLEAVYVAVYFDVVQGIEFGNAGAVGIPYFGVNGSGFILEDYVVVGFAVFGDSRLFMFTEVNVKYSVAFFVVLNVFHVFSNPPAGSS